MREGGREGVREREEREREREKVELTPKIEADRH